MTQPLWHGAVKAGVAFFVLHLQVMGAAPPRAQASMDIPALNWTERSDWINVQADVEPAAVGDGVADDTAAIQAAMDRVQSGSVLYLPAGAYRITNALILKPERRVTGVLVVGHGRDTQLVWDGRDGEAIWRDHGVAHSRYIGLSFDGRGRAAVGLHHFNEAGGFETEVGHRHMAFRNFTDAGILADGNPATAEVMIENCLFEDCGRGIAFVRFNDYNWTIDGCEFRRCGIGVQARHGNTYIRNSRFEESTDVDIQLNPEHGCSVRRTVSVGSRMFINYGNPVAPLSVEGCLVDSWTNPDAAISIGWAPVALFDNVFTRPPGKHPPVQIRGGQQRLFVSQNVSAGTEYVVTPGVGRVYEIPAGERDGNLTCIDTRFLRDTADVPTVVFDVRRDFGALGNGRDDDTDAIQQAIDAARGHGAGAIAYLPTGTYAVTRALQVTGADYTIGGTGFRTGLLWRGPEGGTLMEIEDPQGITIENLNVGSHDVALSMTNAYDIRQTGRAETSEITYDNVAVWGMYRRDPFNKGLALHDLAPGAVVRIGHVQGNIRLRDAARATVLLGNSYEGSVVIEGESPERDGITGILSRLGTSCTHVLYVRKSHSVIGSDFYVEQADNGFHFTGSPGDPPGRITLHIPKMHMGPAGMSAEDLERLGRVPFEMRNYHGGILVGPVQFYINPVEMRLTRSGEAPGEMIVWGGAFYNTRPVVDAPDGAGFGMVGAIGIGEQRPDESELADTLAADGLDTLAKALDDLRRLGEADLRVNHPGVLERQR